ADWLNIGEIIRFIDGPIAPVDCVSASKPKDCEYPGQCPFFEFWGRVRRAIADVVDQTTFADLISENSGRDVAYVADWSIETARQGQGMHGWDNSSHRRREPLFFSSHRKQRNPLRYKQKACG
ncbi:MAG: hypothetical protein JO161_01135, partial [Planctomycetaceae bacterium]|nr:hypothetical protein [Planctomycetaceae bacterium]